MIKKLLLCILISVSMMGGVLAPPAFGIDDNIEFYVSPAGKDTNTGSFENPFKTIKRAKEEVSKYTQNMAEDIYVYIRGGTYYVDETITFTEQDSGRNGYTVHYVNYADEQPVIYGGVRLSDWEPYQGGIYKTYVPDDMDFYALTENFEWATEACYPNEGYLSVASSGFSDGLNTALYFKDGDIPNNLSLEGLRVKSLPHLHYASATWPVTKIDRERNILHMNSKGEQFAIKYTEGEGIYRLIGNLSLLDMPGEFYLDREEGVLYYYPYNDNINDSVIVAPCVKRIFGFIGDGADNPVENISISGLTLSTTDFAESFHQGDLMGNVAGADAMIKLEDAKNISITDCKLLNAGINAIWLKGFAQDNNISGNFIKNVGYVGVSLIGYTAREAMGRFDSLEDAYCNKNNIIHMLRNIQGLRYTFDIGNFLCVQEDVLKAYKLFKEYIQNVHIKDWIYDEFGYLIRPEIPALNGCVMGEGILPLTELLSNMKEDGFDGELLLEINTVSITKEIIEKSVDFVKSKWGDSLC